MGASATTFTTTGGLAIAGDFGGDPDRPLVLLLHGGGQTRHAWGGTAKVLAGHGWRTLSLDARGHGSSAWAPDADYSLTAFADDLRQVIGQVGGPPPVLVGASLGGITALFLEGELAPGTARALALVDVAPRMEESGTSRIRDFMNRPEGFESLDEAADAVAAYNPHRPRPDDVAGLAKNLRLDGDGRWRWHWDPRFLDGGRGPHELSDHPRMCDCARNLAVPTLLVRGRMSDVLSDEGAREMLELTPHARYADVTGAGHMVAGDRNEAFTEAITTFLDDLPPV